MARLPVGHQRLLTSTGGGSPKGLRNNAGRPVVPRPGRQHRRECVPVPCYAAPSRTRRAHRYRSHCWSSTRPGRQHGATDDPVRSSTSRQSPRTRAIRTSMRGATTGSASASPAVPASGTRPSWCAPVSTRRSTATCRRGVSARRRIWCHGRQLSEPVNGSRPRGLTGHRATRARPGSVGVPRSLNGLTRPNSQPTINRPTSSANETRSTRRSGVPV